MTKKLILLVAMFGILLALSLIVTYAGFSSEHTIYENKTTAASFCIKCHPDKVSTLNLSSNVHSNAGCICHGYNPNLTDLYNINTAHNLTKQIYCTNCHSNYNITSGDIIIYHDIGLGDISGINQTAHYIINGSTDKTPVYARAKSFFNGS